MLSSQNRVLAVLIASGSIAAVALTAIVLPAIAAPTPPNATHELIQGFAERCAAMPQIMAGLWPDPTTHVITAIMRPAGYEITQAHQPDQPGIPLALPPHCEVEAVMRRRSGVDGQNYAIRFRLRLPEAWTGRLLFQGGGGTNGTVGDAIGPMGAGRLDALSQGYAVLAQDSGHDNTVNSDPARGGTVAFGFDPVARADYGGLSLRPVTLAAKAMVARFFGKAPRYAYFMGCSKGGQEGMMVAQRYPDLFDGIVAAAPGFSLPRAALAEAWNTQAFAGVLQSAGQPVTMQNLARTFSAEAGALVRSAVLAACDRDDGLADGIVGAPAQCTSAKVIPKLRAATCRPGNSVSCLSDTQVAALAKIHDGLRDSAGRQIYPGFAWDAGWFDGGWRIWMTGLAQPAVPALNVVLGGPSRAAVFSTPPQPVPSSPEALLAYQLAFSADRDAGAILRREQPFVRSSWEDIGARSIDLSAFHARGGKLLIPHGVSDPVFSVNDTIAWWRDVDAATGGHAARFARVFPIPGMAHCQGGPATDQTDAFDTLVKWVEQGQSPDQISGEAGPGSPWPGRKRPICRYPLELKAKVSGGKESFACVAPVTARGRR